MIENRANKTCSSKNLPPIPNNEIVRSMSRASKLVFNIQDMPKTFLCREKKDLINMPSLNVRQNTIHHKDIHSFVSKDSER